MKILTIVVLICLSTSSNIYSQFVSPQSIIWNEETNTYIISDPGAGKLFSMDKNGNISEFTTGLNKPKGLIADILSLWVVDGSKVIEIDPESGVVINNFTVPGAQNLHDAVMDEYGYLYISDLSGNKIFKFDALFGESEVFSVGVIISPAGIYYDILGGLIVVSNSQPAKIYSVDLEQGNVEELMQTQIPKLDGIAYDTKRDKYYISSNTTNSIYEFDPSFQVNPAILKGGFGSPRDIYYQETSDTLAIPEFLGKKISFIGFTDPEPDLKILGTKQVCGNTQQTYYASLTQGKSNVWSVSGGEIKGSNTKDSVIIQWGITENSSVKLIQTDLNNMKMDTAELSIEILIPPQVNITGSDTACSGGISKFRTNKNSGVNYKWKVYNGTFVDRSDLDSVIVKWNTINYGIDSIFINGNITIEQKNLTTGCSEVNISDILIFNTPNPEISGNNFVCTGDTADYKLINNINGNNTFEVVGGSIIDYKGDSLITVLWENSINGSIKYVVTNDYNCSDSITLNVTINQLPDKPTIELIGEMFKSSYAKNYQWYKDGQIIAGANERNLNVTEYGIYMVEISDSNGCKNKSYPYDYTVYVDDQIPNLNNINVVPNPANENAEIVFQLQNSGFINIILTDIIGNEKLKILDNIFMSAGIHRRLMSLEGMPSGIYLCKIIFNGYSKTLKVLVIK